MNGGFVTLTDMVAAVHNGWATGISIARPVAAEPGFIQFQFHRFENIHSIQHFKITIGINK